MKTPEELKAYRAEWNRKNAEAQKAKKAAYYQENKERLKAAVRKRYLEKTDECKATMKAWYEGNRDKVLAEKKEYWVENHEHIKARKQRHDRSNPRAAATDLVCGRAKMKGRAVDREYLESLPCPTHCPILGTPIDFRRGEGNRDRRNTASFDRKDSARGYVSGNVEIISAKANTMKQDANIEELQAFARWVQKTYGLGG